MKCDELKPLVFSLNDLAYVDEPTAQQPNFQNPHEHAVYKATEVDAAIAELKARIQLDDDEMAGFLDLEEECGGGDLRNYIAELKAKLDEKYKEIESLKASHYAESVDAGMRERMLTRALWLARAERANDNYRLFYFSDTFGEPLNIKGYSDPEKGATKMRDSAEWKKFFLKVERKCLAKAEEYK